MRQALELALEALETPRPFDSYPPLWRAYEKTINEAITAIKEALAQPEQEPVAQCTESDSWNCKYCRKTESCKALQDPRNFASPPQRTWVGLTDEEKQEWIDAMPYDPQPRHCMILVNVIEVKLKEKNT